MNSEPNNRILMVMPGGSFFTEPFARAFTRAGYECRVFDSRQGIAYTNEVIRRIMKRFTFLKFFKRWQTDKTNRLLLETVRQYRPAYLFSQKGESTYPETIEAVKNMGVITINLYNDMMHQWDYISRIAPVYDYFFHVDYVVLRRLWEELGLKNCFYMACSAEPLPDPLVDRRDAYNISLIGTHNNALYSKREECLAAVKDLGLNIWGTPGWASSPLAGCFHGPSVGDQRFDIYHKSKIVLDIHWDVLPTDFVNIRVFESMACGALCMTNCADRAAREAYTEDKEIVFFKDADELREKVTYYLSHDAERQAIARAGYARTMAEHTYDARVRQMFDTIKQKGNKRGVPVP